MKKLTIIIPCYNMEKYITKALDSIRLQKCQSNFCKVYIIDDGSKDGSAKLVNNYIEKYKLDNFKLIRKENGNWGSVINYAKNYLNLNTDYVSILDADDYYEEGLFEKLKKLVNLDYDLIFSGFWEVKGKNKITKAYLTPQLGNREIDQKYMRFPSLIPLCKFFRKDIFISLPNLKENASYQDIILWHKFVNKSEKFYYIKNRYGYYLNHREGASSTQAFDEKRISLLMNVVDELISNDVYTNGYLMGLLMHIKKNTPKDKRKLIKFKNINYKKIKNFKLLWCPFGTRTITKVGMNIYLKQIIA